MKKLLAATFLLLILCTHLFAQTPCDQAPFSNMQSQARATYYQSEQFANAPSQLLSALKFIENCPDANAQKAAVYEQLAVWYTGLEQFEPALENLKKAKSLLGKDPVRIAQINLSEARLGLNFRDFDLTNIALNDVFEAGSRLPDSVYTEAGILRARMYFQVISPENGFECLDSAFNSAVYSQSNRLKIEAWEARLDLDFIAGDFKHGLEVADSALALIDQLQDPNLLDKKYHLLETSANLARAIVGIKDGYDRQVIAKQTALSMPPYLRVRYLPAALAMMIKSTFDQEGIEASDSVLARFERLVQPERLSHRALQAEAYSQHGRVLNILGQSEEGIAYCERSNAIIKSLPGVSDQRYASNYLFMTSSYRNIRDYESALRSAKLALAYRKKAQPNHIGLGAFYNEILQIYVENKDTLHVHETLLEFEQLLDKQKDKQSFEQYKYSVSYGWLDYWRLVNQPLKGIQQAEEFLKVSGPKARMRGAVTIDMEYRICDAYREAGMLRQAFDRLEPVVQRLKKRFQDSGSIFYEHYSWVLAQSAYNALLVFEQLGDTALLRQAELRCTEAEDLLFALRNRDPHESQRKFVTDEYLYKCLLYVRAALFQRSGNPWHVERAFAVSESFQLVDLQRVLSEKQALHFGGVGEEASKEENALQKKIARLESEKSGLRFQEPGPETDQLAANIELKLSAARHSYDSLLNALESKFPDYYNLKYKLPVLSLKEVRQQMLQPGQCLLKMYNFYDTVICLLLRPDTSLLLMTHFNGQLQDDLLNFLDGLQKYPEIAAQPEAVFAQKQQAFAAESFRLYENLLKPLAPWLTEQIILSADEPFSSMPFEALLTEPAAQINRPSTWHYFGNDKIISYTSSATIFQFVQKRPALRSELQNALVMAPYFSGNLNALPTDDVVTRVRADFFTPLPYTGKEAVAVAQLLNGKALAGAHCGVDDFINQAAQYKVLHLATHASAGGQGRPAFISFQPADNNWRSAMLFESDIYALPLSADLVTLSACQTALGKRRYGDGLQGLTRAFTCAGARNIVASLWTVNDAATKDLMIDFYREIKNGMPYNSALAKAKRAFIQENRQFAHPYYWAGFVLNGR
jgi:CHAT domain-containing protein